MGSGPVTLVFLDQTTLSANGSSGLQITAPSGTLSPSTTYPWPGVAIYFARGNTATLSLSGSSGILPVTGAIYAPNATLTTSGSSGLPDQSLVIVGAYQGSGSSTLTVTYNANQNPPLPGSLRLVQ